MGPLLKLGLPAAVLLAVAFQILLKDAVWLLLGVGKHIQAVDEFPYECRRIDNDPRLQACEDMWLSEETRVLYLACSDPVARTRWLPSIHKFDMSGRSERDAIVAMQIDEPVDGSFEYRTLQTPAFAGTAGDGLLSIVGISGVDVHAEGEDRVELFLVNHRPSLDPETGAPSKDQSSTGGNATVEHFEIRGSRAEEMTHLRTWADDAIATPNRPAVAEDRGFYVTNSHGSHKVGLSSKLSLLLGTGDVAFCSQGKGCRRVSSGHKGPNGLVRNEGLVYVPNMLGGNVQVFNITGDGGLVEVEDIHLGYAIDNLSVDAEGNVYAAAFPAMAEMARAFGDPLNGRPSATVLRIRKGDDGRHRWEKVVEDGEGATFSGATTVVHDAKTGRLFLSGVISPYITVCEPRS